MNLTRSTATLLAGLLAVPMFLTAPAARGQDALGDLVSKSLDAMTAEKWEEAVTILNSAVDRFGKNPGIWGPQFGVIYYRKGICEIKLKRWGEAMKSFETCYRDFPNAGANVKAGGGNIFHKKALLRWGEAAMGGEDWALAIRQFNKFLKERDPNEPNDRYPLGSFQINMAICHYRLGKIPEGNGYLETAIKNKNNPAYNIPDAGIASGFQALVIAVIDKNNEQALLDFIDKNRADITLAPYEMAEFTKLYMKLAADAIAVDMERAAMQLYQLIPTTEAALQDTEFRVKSLSTRPSVRDGNRKISTRVLQNNLKELETEISTHKVPEITKLAAAAFLHEQDGDTRGAYAAYELLELDHPKAERREDYLYHLVRTSSVIGEVLNTEKYGQRFLKVFPNSKHVPQVRRMLLSSLFYEGEYATCIEVASVMLPSLPEKSKEHDICLHVLGGSYYYTGEFEKAQDLLDRHVKLYPESQFTEAARYFQASNLSRLQRWEESATLLDAFFKKYPDPKSNIFYPFALYDRANCHYAISDKEYEQALEVLKRLETEFPNAEVMEMALNLKGNVQQSLDRPEDAEKSYLAALKLAETRQNDNVIGEALYYLVAMLGDKKKNEKEPNPRLKDAVPYADRFWKDGGEQSVFKTQMAVAQVAALDSVGRGEEALGRLETVIADLANGDDKSGLEAVINSYTDAYLEKHGATELKARYYDFPGIKAGNVEARAILRMAVVGVFEEVGSKAAKDDEETRRQASAAIKVLFEELKRDFQPAMLTNHILVRVGDYIRKTASFRESLPYYDEVIGRKDESNRFKALLGRGDVYSRSTAPAELDKAIVDFQKVFKDSNDKPEKESALFGIVSSLMAKKDYAAAAEQAKEYLDKTKYGFSKKSADVSMMLAQSYDLRGEVNDAIAMYAKVWGAYMGLIRISAPAMTRWMELCWTRNLPSRTDTKGYTIISDRQNAYDNGAKFIESTSREDFQKKMVDEDKALWKVVEGLVIKYQADPAIKSLADQRKERESGRRRR